MADTIEKIRAILASNLRDDLKLEFIRSLTNQASSYTVIGAGGATTVGAGGGSHVCGGGGGN